MSVQDDAREKNMVRMFNLKQDKDRKRHEADAQLDFDGNSYQFELKSTTTGSLSTVRDFGKDHVEKWKEMHWIVGFYDKDETEDPRYCVYLSPEEMSVWVDKIWDYVAPDYEIGTLAPQRLELEDMYVVCHAKERYLLSDAERLHKKQYSKPKYLEEMDLSEAISRENFFRFVSPKLLPELAKLVDTDKGSFSLSDLESVVSTQKGSSFFENSLDDNKRIPRAIFSEIFPPALIDDAHGMAAEKGLTVKRAIQVMSKPLTKARRKAVFDIEPGYSPSRMLNIFRDRANYLVRRGSTLNNPHIPGEFFDNFERITEDHASKLRELLKARAKLHSE